MTHDPKYPSPTPPLLGPRSQFIVLPHFSSLGLSLLTEPLFIANWLLGKPRYSWRLLSVDGQAVVASDGQAHAVTGALSAAVAGEPAFVLASFEPGDSCRSAPLASALRSVARKGTLVAGIETGSEALAHAGLLDHRRAAIHWDCQSPLRERHPDIDITGSAYEIDGRIATSAGALSNLDLMLHLIEQAEGPDLPAKISRHLLHRRNTQGEAGQAASTPHPDGSINDRLQRTIAMMQAHIEDPVPSPEIAQRLGLSQRQLERDFSSAYGLAPGKFYRQLRLNHAHRLLQQTTLSVTEVAVASGYRSSETFSRAYLSQFGLPPSKDRLLSTSAPASWLPPVPR